MKGSSRFTPATICNSLSSIFDKKEVLCFAVSSHLTMFEFSKAVFDNSYFDFFTNDEKHYFSAEQFVSCINRYTCSQIEYIALHIRIFG